MRYSRARTRRYSRTTETRIITRSLFDIVNPEYQAARTSLGPRASERAPGDKASVRRRMSATHQSCRLASLPWKENTRGENRFPPGIYNVPPLFFPCYFNKSNQKTLAHQWIGGNRRPILF